MSSPTLIIDIIFLAISTLIALVYFIALIKGLSLIRKRPASYTTLLCAIMVFFIWFYYAQLNVFLPPTYFVTNILPSLLTIFIIFVVAIIFNTPYLVPPIRKVVIFHKIVHHIGFILIGYIIAKMLSNEPPLIVTYNEHQLKFQADLPLIIMICAWGFLYIILLLISTRPISKFIKRRRDSITDIIYLTGTILLAVSTSLFIVSFIMMTSQKVSLMASIIYNLSNTSLLLSLTLITIAGLKDPSILSSMINLIEFYFNKRMISIIVSIFSERGPEIVLYFGPKNIEINKAEEVQITKFAVNTMSLFGMGHNFTVGSTFTTVPFNKDSCCLSLTGWINDEMQEEPRFKGETYTQLQVILPKHIEWVLFNRKFWEQEYAKFLRNIKSRQELKNEKKWVEFIESVIKHEALKNK